MVARLIRPAVALLALLVFASGSGITISQAQEEGQGWQQLGAALPAGTWSFASDNADPPALYALNDEGISKSADGKSWSACKADAHAMSVVPPSRGQQGDTFVYAVTPAGLQRSEDGCATWKSVSTRGILPSGAQIRWLAPYPNNRDVLYAGLSGLGGIYRSMDAGVSWQSASKGLPPGAWITSLAADLLTPSRVFASVRYVTRSHHPVYLYKSEDGGLSWKPASAGLRLLTGIGGYMVGLGWSGEALFAATRHDGLYRSLDRGASWERATLPRRASVTVSQATDGIRSAQLLPPLPLAISGFAALPDGALTISTPEGVYSSADGGRSWQNFNPGGFRGERALLAVEPGSGRVMLGGSDAVWAARAPRTVALLPTSTPATVAELPPTPPPPPPPPTSTPQPTQPPSPTSTPLPTPTAFIAGGPLPTDRVGSADPEISTYFEETGHNIKYAFRDYWASNNGIFLLGYPLTEEFVENGVTVQYFERARLEYRDGKVQMGRLGAELTAGRFFRPVPFFPTTDDRAFFGPTGHSVSGPFLELWKEYGGLETFGYPLSEAFREQGSEYQWFERARFEWHSYLPEGKRLTLGQLGKEALQQRGWIR